LKGFQAFGTLWTAADSLRREKPAAMPGEPPDPWPTARPSGGRDEAGASGSEKTWRRGFPLIDRERAAQSDFGYGCDGT
jgi:hypothetical protein